LDIYLDLYEEQRNILLKIVRSIKKYCKDYGFYDSILLLCSVPGIGFINAVVLITELIDIKRFTDFDSLASYVGLVPSKRSSSEKEYTLGLTMQCKLKLREILVESS
jgi:transposase